MLENVTIKVVKRLTEYMKHGFWKGVTVKDYRLASRLEKKVVMGMERTSTNI